MHLQTRTSTGFCTHSQPVLHIARLAISLVCSSSPCPPSQCPLTASCPSQPVLCNSTNDRSESFSFPCGTWTSFYR